MLGLAPRRIDSAVLLVGKILRLPRTLADADLQSVQTFADDLLDCHWCFRVPDVRWVGRLTGFPQPAASGYALAALIQLFSETSRSRYERREPGVFAGSSLVIKPCQPVYPT